MIYRVTLPIPVVKELDRLPITMQVRIEKEIKNLEQHPRPPGCLKLTGRNAWRIKVGDYRVLYEIDDDNLIIIIVRVRHRKDSYR